MTLAPLPLRAGADRVSNCVGMRLRPFARQTATWLGAVTVEHVIGPAGFDRHQPCEKSSTSRLFLGWLLNVPATG